MKLNIRAQSAQNLHNNSPSFSFMACLAARQPRRTGARSGDRSRHYSGRYAQSWFIAARSGHGLSGNGRDLLDTLDAQQIEKATFIGHSMGGKAVMALTALAPDRIDRLVAIDIAPWIITFAATIAFSRPLTPSANPTRHPANRRQGLCANTSTKKA